MAPLVSVVTPVYNGQKYLEECLGSVLAQTLPDFEHVVVDNCSTDDTAAIVARVASRDGRLRLIRATEFVDVHQNHNRALRAIDPRSKYVKIIHADDFLYPECLAKMVAAAEAAPAVGLVSSYRLEDRKLLHDGLFPYWETTMPGREALRRSLVGTSWVTGSPSSLLFRADLVRREPAFFDGSVWHSDTDAAYRLLLSSDLGFVHQVLTFTRLHPGALTSYSHRVNTYIAQEGRMLLRYGPRVLEVAEYRPRLREWLRRYAFWLARQALKPSRLRQAEYHRYHRKEIDALIAESAGDKGVRLLLGLSRRLLRDVSEKQP